MVYFKDMKHRKLIYHENRPSLGRASAINSVILGEPIPGSNSTMENGYESSGGHSSGHHSDHSGHVSPALSQMSLADHAVIDQMTKSGHTPSGTNRGQHQHSGPRSVTGPKPCSKCGQMGSQRCSNCKIPYCSRECQLTDWSTHKLTCKKPVQKTQAQRDQEEFEARFDIEIGDDFAEHVAKQLSQNVDIPSSSPAQSLQHAVQRSPQDGGTRRNVESGSVDARSGPQPVCASSKATDTGQSAPRLMYKDAAKASLNSGSKVLVTSLENPHEFWVVSGASIGPLMDLKQSMDKYYATTTNTAPSSFVPEVGQVCAGRFSQDGGWYRARVDRVLLDGSLALTYIDYGNKEEVTVSEVRKLLSEFTTFPLQASCCCLGRVQHASDMFTPEVLKRTADLMPCNGIFEIHVASRERDRTVVDMIDRSPENDGRNVANQLISEGLLKPLSNVQKPDKTPKQPDATPTKTSPQQPSPTVVPSGANSAARASPKAAPPAKAKPRPEIPPPKLPTAAKYLSKMATVQIAGMALRSPGEFWAQVLDDSNLQLLTTLKQEMNNHYNRLPPKTGFTPLASKLYACRFSSDNEWYRAQVLDFDTTKAYVIYLDYGNQEVVEFHNIHSLESQFCQLPFQAVRFALYGVGPADGSGVWSKESTMFFTEHFQGPVKAKVCDKDEIHTHVRILTGDHETLNDKMIQAGFARLVNRDGTPTPVQSPPRATVPVSTATRVMADDLPKLEIPEKDVEVSVVDAPNPVNIVIHLLTDELKMSIAAVCQAMTLCKAPTKPYTPIKGEAVVAQFSGDKCWYRAQVKEVESPKSIVVYFMDFGNMEAVSCDIIMPLPAEMKLYPPLGIICCMANVDQEKSSDAWDPSLLVNQCFSLKIKTKGIQKLEVELFHLDTGISLNKQLLEAGVVFPKETSSAESDPTVVSLSTLEKISYKPGAELQVLVTDATSPTDFTIQDCSVSKDHLPTMEPLLATLHEGYVGIYVPTVHELVTTRFKEDGLWYRASVDRVVDKTVSLTLVDYGNKQAVSADSVNKLDHQLLQFPLLGIRCTLAGVGGVSGKPWDPRHLFPMEKILNAKVVSVAGDVAAVDLINPDNGSCINQQLLQLGVVVPAQSHGTTALDARTKENMEAAKAAAPPAPTPKVEQPIPKKPEEKPVWVAMAADLGVQTLKEDVLSLMIHFITPANFYIQNLETANDLNMLIAAMGETYSQLKESHVPAAGELVAAFCGEDSAWYRAAVLKVGGSSILVHYVDFGNDATVPLDAIRRLQKRYVDLPAMAIECGFERSFSVEATKALQSKLGGIPIGVLMSGQVDGIHQVKDVFNAQNGACILQEMIEMGLIPKEDGPTSASVAAPEKNTALPPGVFDGQTLKYQHLPDSNVKVKIVYTVTPGEFYLQVNEEWCQTKFIWLSKEVNVYCEQEPNIYKPRVVGELVCAKLDIWYRAVVQEILPDDMCRLTFIDYGNVNDVPVSQIRAMLEQFVEVPRQGIPCRLLDLQGNGQHGEWVESDVTWFKRRFPEETLVFSLKPTNKKDGDCNCIDLLLDGNTTASQVLLEEKRARLPAEPVPEPPKPKPEEIKPANPPPPQRVLEQQTPPKPSTLIPSEPDLKKIPTLDDLPERTLAPELTVAVTEVQSPELFYCQEASDKGSPVSERMANISGDLMKFCNKTTPVPGFCPKAGELCAAYNQMYSEWYRACVLAAPGAGPAAAGEVVYRVQFVDFGDFMEIPATDVRPLPEPLLRYPQEAIRCCLTGIFPIGPSWQISAIEELKKLVIGPVLFTMKVVDHKGTLQLVNLVCRETASDVGEALVKHGLAMSMNTPNVPPLEVQPTGHHADSSALGLQSTAPRAPQPVQQQVDLHSENIQLKKEVEDLKQQMASIFRMLNAKNS